MPQELTVNASDLTPVGGEITVHHSKLQPVNRELTVKPEELQPVTAGQSTHGLAAPGQNQDKVSSGATISQEPKHSVFARTREWFANSPVGHAFQQEFPAFAEHVGLAPTETVYAPHDEPLLNLNVEQHEELARSIDENKHPVQAFISDLDVAGVKAVSGLTTPSNVALLVGMMFLPEASVIKKLADFGFSANMAVEAMHEFRDAYKAWKSGDKRQAVQIGATGAINSLFAALGTRAGRKSAEAPKPKVIGSSQEPVVAEHPETVEKQVEALKTGTVPVVMVPKGGEVPKPPAGMQSVEVKEGPGAGTYVFNPSKVSAKEIRKAAEAGKHGELLGHNQSKAELAGKPTVVVQAVDKADGVPIQDSEVENDPAKIEAQKRVMQERHPEAQVAVKTPQEVVQERVPAPAEDKPTPEFLARHRQAVRNYLEAVEGYEKAKKRNASPEIIRKEYQKVTAAFARMGGSELPQTAWADPGRRANVMKVELYEDEAEKHGAQAQGATPQGVTPPVSASEPTLYEELPEAPGKPEAVERMEAQLDHEQAQLAGLSGKTPRGARGEAESAQEPSGVPETKETPSEESPRAPAVAVRVPIGSLEVAPREFQYKLGLNPETGAHGDLEDVPWNEDLAGIISVWHDPKTEKTYVVNGHNRYDLAKRRGRPDILVKFIDAPDRETARAIGALQNIAEGKGTAVDAAKFFRDTGRDVNDLAKVGITMSEAKANEGIALAKLDARIFEDVATGKIPVGRGVAIGKATDVPSQQEAILKLIQKREAKGRNVTNSVIEELGRMVRGSAEHTETQENLFGVQEMTRNLALEKAEVSDFIRRQIGQEKRLFSGVASESTAEKLGAKGNVIKAEENAKIAAEAAQAQELYDRLSTRAGDVDEILNRAADELANGEEPNAVKQRAYEDARKTLAEAIKGTVEPRAEGVQEARGTAAEADHPAAGEPESAVKQHELTVGDTTYKSRFVKEGELYNGNYDMVRVEAYRGGKKIASVDLGINEHGEGTHAAISSGLEVTESERGKGVARKMYEALPQIAKEYGITTIQGEGVQSGGGKGVWESLLRDNKAYRAKDIYGNDVYRMGSEPIHAETDQEPLVPTLPGMENVPAERAEAAAEAQGERLTAEAAQPAESISAATGKMERESPLFRDTEASGQGQMFRSSLFGADIAAEVAAKAAKGLYEEDVAPGLGKLKTTLTEAFNELSHWIAPRYGVATQTLDTMMRLAGEREKRRFLLDQMMFGWRKIFDKLPKEDGVAFIDRYKRGETLPPEFQELADFESKTDDETHRHVVDAQVRTLSEDAQKLWASLTPEEKDAFRHNLDKLKAEELPEDGEEGGVGKITKEIADMVVNYKENHQRVLWDKLPEPLPEEGEQEELFDEEAPVGGVPAEGTRRGARPVRRSFYGTKGFLKHSTLVDMSEGLERGGVPYTYNPVEMFQLAQADAWRYITALHMWADAKEQGARVFIHGEKRGPDGFKRIDGGRIGKVQFPAASGEGLVTSGYWWLRDDYARLMSNYLSEDWVRKSGIVHGILYTKNLLTQWRLGFSLFHAMTTTVSGVASELGIGMREVNYGLRKGDVGKVGKGFYDAATAIAAPVMRVKLGRNVLQYIRDPEGFSKTEAGKAFLKLYPEVKEYIDDAFHAGAKFGLHEDEKNNAIAGLRRSWANADWGKNPIGSAWRLLWHTPGAAMEGTFIPLFEWYVPMVKLGSFFREHSFNLADYADAIASGKMTRQEVSRIGWNGIDDLFGQVNWDKFFWNRGFKTGNQILFRAAQWAAGNYRLTKNALTGQMMEVANSARYVRSKFSPRHTAEVDGSAIPRLDPNFAKVLGLFMAWTAGNAILQFAATSSIEKDKDGNRHLKLGELPHDAYDLMAARIGGTDIHGKPKRITIPAVVMTDAMSLYYHGATSYISAKVSDLLGGIFDAIRNEDFNHNMVHNPQDAWWEQRWQDIKHIVGSPIAFSQSMQMYRAGEGSKAIMGAIGFKSPPTGFGWTKAERSAYEMLQAKRTSLTPEEQDDLQRYLELRQQGKLTPAEQRRIAIKQKVPFIVRLAKTSVKGQPVLSFEQLLHIYKEADETEKKELKPLILRRFKDTKKIMDPERRAKAVAEFVRIRDGK